VAINQQTIVHTVFYRKGNASHQLGMDFFIHKGTRSAVKRVQFRLWPSGMLHYFFSTKKSRLKSTYSLYFIVIWLTPLEIRKKDF
jgi:hypothetical protein